MWLLSYLDWDKSMQPSELHDSYGITAQAMTNWAIALAASLELGVFVLAYLGVLDRAATLTLGFALGAVLVAAIVLRPEGERLEDKAPRD
jgi:hypothetical protein